MLSRAPMTKFRKFLRLMPTEPDDVCCICTIMYRWFSLFEWNVAYGKCYSKPHTHTHTLVLVIMLFALTNFLSNATVSIMLWFLIHIWICCLRSTNLIIRFNEHLTILKSMSLIHTYSKNSSKRDRILIDNVFSLN